MPIYEYRCDSCNNQFELRQKFSDPPADRCPNCGAAVRKLVSAVSFSLKGSGWYGDGYGTKAETVASDAPATAAGPATETPIAVPTEGQSTDSAATAPAAAETSAAQPSTANQDETKSKAAEPPTRDKSEMPKED